MLWFFILFFISGFCSILYEIVWLRLAMAQFGVTTAFVSIVLSMFMAGLGVGSFMAGRLIRHSRVSAFRIYAILELLIGISAFAVPLQLIWGRDLLASYVATAIWLALTLIPWCACMGATIPVAMVAISTIFPNKAVRSFSFLYLANVCGAVMGTFIPLFLIELFGFKATLAWGAVLNFSLFFCAMILSYFYPVTCKLSIQTPVIPSTSNNKLLGLLFLSGLTSMGMEIVWIRLYTVYVGTMVYSFAAILGLYLIATYLGSQLYRYFNSYIKEDFFWMLLILSGLLPLVVTSPTWSFSVSFRLLIGIAPFSFILGYLTPMLVDQWSKGMAYRAGNAYAINVLGCILGPLLAGFILLPIISERWALVVLILPWLVIGLKAKKIIKNKSSEHKVLTIVVILIACLIIFKTRDFESRFAQYQLKRDHTATILAIGSGMKKRLLVNGVGITELTPITKAMAHLPLAFLDHKPKNALMICFGMGTTFRSLLSWDIKVTAVELVPSVPQLFSYYHVDGPALLHSPLAHIVIDDGRRYLERNAVQYDVITIDPPPPVEASGSSLLYSKEFYQIVKKRLTPEGILQQWLPKSDVATQAAVVGALLDSFPYVRVFSAIDESKGMHFLASSHPLLFKNAKELARQLPAKAAKDFIEWGPSTTVAGQFEMMLREEKSPQKIIEKSPNTPILQDDKPINEYYLLRRLIF